MCNEKRLVEAAGLNDVHALFGQVPRSAAELVRWVDLVADRLGVPADENTPWSDAGRGMNLTS